MRSVRVVVVGVVLAAVAAALGAAPVMAQWPHDMRRADGRHRGMLGRRVSESGSRGDVSPP